MQRLLLEVRQPEANYRPRHREAKHCVKDEFHCLIHAVSAAVRARTP
jgi:hypothetical protein